MKIAKLHLMSYGPFTDRELDLSRTNFNLIFGPNEGGKSSSLRAIIALLYGIPSKTDDDFLHRYADLRVGATLENSESRQVSFARRKKTKGSLVTLDEAEDVLPDNLLDDFLRGTEKQRFCDIHCINHDQFRAGGRLMLELQGLADDSLLAASNSANFPSLQNNLRAQVQDLYAPRKPTSQFLKAKKEFDEARKAKKDLAVAVKRWQALEEEKRRLEEEKAAIDQQRTSIRTEEKKLTKLHGVLPKIADWKRRSEELAGQDLACLPASYDVEQRKACEKELDGIASNLRHFDDSLSDLKTELQSIQESPELITQAAQIEHLQQRIGTQLEATASRDAQQQAWELADRDVRQLLASLQLDADLDQLEQWRLSREQRSTIRQLATDEKELRERTRRLQLAIAETDLSIQQRDQSQDAADHATDIQPLATEVKQAKRLASLEEEINRQRSKLATLESRAQRNLATLPLWNGTLEELALTKLPLQETISKFADDFVRSEEQLRRSQQTLKAHEEELSELQERIAASKRATAVVTEDDLRQARDQRDHGWQLIKKSWRDGKTIDVDLHQYAGPLSLEQAYEANVAESDTVADRLRRESDRVAKLAQQEERELALAKATEKLKQEYAALRDNQEALQQDWSGLWKESGIAQPRTPREMGKWLEQRSEILGQANEIAELRQILTDQTTRYDRVCQRLQQCLESFGIHGDAGSLHHLLDLAEAHLNEQQAHREQQQQQERDLQRLRKEREQCVHQLQAASEELEQWQKGWSAAMQWIACDVDTTAIQAMARLESIEELLDRYDDWKRLKSELLANETAESRFAEDVAAICARVDIVAAEESHVETAQRLKQALDEAVQKQQAAHRLRKAIDKQQQKVAEQKESQRVLEHQIQKLLTDAGVDSRDELLRVEEFSQLSQQRDVVEQEIRAVAGGLDFHDFLQQAENKDEAELEVRIEQLDIEFKELEQKRDDVRAKISQVEAEMDQIDGNDAYAKADQQAINRLSQIHDLAGRYVRLKIAESVLRQQVERYREQNKDPLLARASEYFAAMTCNEFLGLQVDYDEKTGKPVIVGIRSHQRQPIDVSAMSDGTRDPLFLSLRLAYLERRISAYEPMPLIVDDILIHLDDQRALATLQVLADLSSQMQVLFFTHHDRLRELAERHLPVNQLTVHELTKPMLAT